MLALAGGETVAAAARKANVAERTLYRWLNDEDFRREVNQARAEMFRRAAGCMAEGAVSGALTLRQLCLRGKSENVRLGAARALIDLGAKLSEIVDLEERLSALERQAGEEGRARGR